MSKLIRDHTQLDVYKKAFSVAMEIFEMSKQFPIEETYSLTDQIRRSSRSVCSNLAEAWRKRPYEAMFVNKLTDSEMEAAETQVWLDFAVECKYMNPAKAAELQTIYDGILGSLVGMRINASSWVLPQGKHSQKK